MSKNDTAIRELLEDASQQITNKVEFFWGADVHDVNVFSDKLPLDYIWMTPLEYTGTFPTNYRLFKSYSIILYFYRQDTTDSSDKDRRDIVEAMDEIVTHFVLKLRELLEYQQREFDFTDITVSNFFKQTTKILSGKQLSFTLNVPDDFEYCK